MKETFQRVQDRIQEKIDRINLINLHRRLENEPRLFTRSEVIEFMQKAQTLYAMEGKFTEKHDLDSLIP